MALMSANSAQTVLAHAARRLSSQRPLARERRRFRRTPLVLGGRMLDQRGREHDCRTADISPGDVRIAATSEIEVGARVVLYLEGLGRVAGRVVRKCGENEYAIVFEQSSHKREKLAETLTILMNRAHLADEENEDGKSAPASRYARIELEDGGAIEGLVLDFSLAGVTVQSQRRPPPIGAWVRIGGVHGRVARYTETGFSVDFEFSARPPG
jgi:hypothetical protein